MAWALGYGDPLAATREIGRFWTGRPVIQAADHLAFGIVVALAAGDRGGDAVPPVARSRGRQMGG